MVLLGKIFSLFDRFVQHEIRQYEKTKFKSIGKNVYIGKSCIFTHDNILIGDDVYIGANACIQSAHGQINIGNHVMFGPGVHIHGGNHGFDVIGTYIKDIQKHEGQDGEVVIGDDVWIGSNAIILSGVHIGEGSVIGAGAIVTKDIPPYSIYTGAPPQKLRKRFTDKELEKHKKLLADRMKC